MPQRHRPSSREPLTLVEFEARREPPGLFESYCRARVRHFALRQVLPAVVGTVLLIEGSMTWAPLIALAIFLADGLDCLVLRRFIRRRPRPDRLPMAQGVAAATAGLHGLTTTIGTGLLLTSSSDLRFLTVTISIGLILDSALLFRSNAPACFARVFGHVLMLMGIYLVAWGDGATGLQVGLVGDTMAAAMMLLFGLSFMVTVHAQRMRGQWMQRATLQQADSLADMNRTLTEARMKARRLAHVVEQTQDCIVVLDQKGHITWSNAAFAHMMQTTTFAISAEPNDFTRVLGARAQDGARIRQAIVQHQPLRADIRRENADGTDTWLDISLSPMRGEWQSGDAFSAVMRDVTQSKRREEALAEARAAAEAAAQAKSTFLATMSHEIRTPMNGVIATSDLLRATHLDGEQTALVETITSSGEALLTIINDILDFSKLDAGKLETARQPFAPGPALRATVDLLAPLAEAKSLYLRLSCPSDLPGRLLGDEARLRQVILNLVGNAIKFTETGGVRLDVAAPVSEGTCALRISVTDTGIGIAEAHQADIFRTFTQADATISRRFGGTGLGLAISRSLVRAMGGDIALSSTVGEGSRFTISLRLPVATAPALSDARVPPPPSISASEDALAGRAILVAEDNRTNRMLLEKMLNRSGARLTFAENGADAVRDYARSRPDLVLMDMSMPVMDGLEATESIRALEAEQGWPRCTIFALTANAFDDDRQRCRDAGMDGHMSKPIRKAVLIDTLTSHFSAPPVPNAPGHDAFWPADTDARNATPGDTAPPGADLHDTDPKAPEQDGPPLARSGT